MWVLFAVLNPLSDSFRNLFGKRASGTIDPLLISWSNNIIPFILFFPGFFLIDFVWNRDFIIGLLGSGLLNTAAVILYFRAISSSDISIVVPMLSFTPLFLLVTSPIMIGEFPQPAGLVGVLLIVGGSYLLNVKAVRGGLLKPLKALLEDKGARYMLGAALIFSFTANFDKTAVTASSVPQYIISLNAFIVVSISILILLTRKFSLSALKSEKRNLLMMGALTACTFIFHMTALSMTLVAYVVSIKRSSGMISVILGGLFLKEKDIKDRAAGASIMFIGVLIIIFFS